MTTTTISAISIVWGLEFRRRWAPPRRTSTSNRGVKPGRARTTFQPPFSELRNVSDNRCRSGGALAPRLFAAQKNRRRNHSPAPDHRDHCALRSLLPRRLTPRHRDARRSVNPTALFPAAGLELLLVRFAVSNALRLNAARPTNPDTTFLVP